MEGMSPQVLENALRQAGATILDETAQQKVPSRSITKADFFRDGLTGAPDSSQRRDALKKKLGLPQRLTANSLLAVLNQLYDYDTYQEMVEELEQEPAWEE